jgi:hypothetical protein
VTNGCQAGYGHSGGEIVGKERNTKKENKKKPAKTLKEKRREKKLKKMQQTQ